MCIVEQWCDIYPNGTRIPRQHITHCRRGTPRTPCQWTQTRELPDVLIPSDGPEARLTAVGAMDGATVMAVTPRQPSKTRKETSSQKDTASTKLIFKLHIPFTNKKEKSSITLINPVVSKKKVHGEGRFPALSLLPPPPPPLPLPHAGAYGRASSKPFRQHMANGPINVPRNGGTPATFDENRPAIINIEPQVSERGRQQNRNHRSSSRQRPLAVREHSRRPARRYSPERRNHSPGRLARINARLAELEEELQRARRAAQRETLARVEAEIRLETERRTREQEAEVTWVALQQSTERFERERRVRLERDRRRPPLEVHQTPGESLEDRGARVLNEAVRRERDRLEETRAERETAEEGGFDRVNAERRRTQQERDSRERAGQQRPQRNGFENQQDREERPVGRVRRGGHARGTGRGALGEERVIWDDERRRGGRRWT